MGPVFVSFRDFTEAISRKKRNDFHEFSRRGGFVTSAKTRPLVEDRRVAGGAGSGRLGRPLVSSADRSQTMAALG